MKNIKVTVPNWTIDRYFLIFEGENHYKIFKFRADEVESIIKKISKEYKKHDLYNVKGPLNKENLFSLIRGKVSSFSPKIPRDILA